MVFSHQDKESCVRHNGIRNLQYTDAQILPNLQAIRMMQIIYLCCSLLFSPSGSLVQSVMAPFLPGLLGCGS